MGKFQKWLIDFLEIKRSDSEILSIQYLRGIAACMVMFYHFNLTNQTNFAGVQNIIHEIGKRGYIGVEIFFCISGFVLLYALIKAKYEVKDFGNFFLRRIIRIEPPYIVAVLLIVIFSLIRNSIVNSNEQTNLSFLNIIMHFGYINMFTGNWLSPVFWTLGVEFSFYIFIGLSFSFVLKNQLQRAILFGAFFSTTALSNWHFLPFYSGYFVLGMVSCLYYLKIVNKIEYFTYAIISSAFILIKIEGLYSNGFSIIQLHRDAFYRLGLSLLAVILFFRNMKFNLFFYTLGLISYSIYLLHTIIGTRLIIKGLNLPYLSFNYCILYALACIISVVVSILYYKYVELPSLRWAKKLAKSKA